VRAGAGNPASSFVIDGDRRALTEPGALMSGLLPVLVPDHPDRDRQDRARPRPGPRGCASAIRSCPWRAVVVDFPAW
jgi:hypothetical protein